MDQLKENFKIIILFFSVLFTLISFYIYLSFADKKDLKVSYLDVGQGDAIFIETPDRRQILIDGGPSDDVLRGISEKISFFDNKIDLVIATHPDADHITGLISVLKKYEINNLVISPSESKTGVFDTFNDEVSKIEKEKIHIGNSGDEIDLGSGVTFKIVSPVSEVWHGEETNAQSIVGLLTYGDRNFLLTGDLPEKGENLIINKGLLPRNITVLKAGHHGSNTSSGNLFLNYLKPFYSVISSGKKNRYGHPNPEVLERLTLNSKSILNTMNNGTITFITDGNNLRLETEK